MDSKKARISAVVVSVMPASWQIVWTRLSDVPARLLLCLR
jgi:hypothetical protein